jgi:predicted nucleotidyltransferase
MRSALPVVARELGADERTLRRAAQRGAVRCRRPGPRKLEFVEGELDYLRSHWELMRALTCALRTEPNVRIAVLYGSVARGDDRFGSDIDVLVELRDDAPGAAKGLAMRLEGALGRDVDVARLSRARERAPLLVLQALDEGRVLVDRDKRWPALMRERDRIARAAWRAQGAAREQAAAGLRELVKLA